MNSPIQSALKEVDRWKSQGGDGDPVAMLVRILEADGFVVELESKGGYVFVDVKGPWMGGEYHGGVFSKEDGA